MIFISIGEHNEYWQCNLGFVELNLDRDVSEVEMWFCGIDCVNDALLEKVEMDCRSWKYFNLKFRRKIFFGVYCS